MRGVYNRYIPDDASYTQVKDEPPTPPEPKETERRKKAEQPEKPAGEPHSGPQMGGNRQHQAPSRPSQGRPRPSPLDSLGLGGWKPPNLLGGKDGLAALLSGKERGGLSSLLKTMHLDNIDTGDILLLLIILYLLVEGDDLELVIALGLVLIMGLGDREDGDGQPPQSEQNN